MIHHIKLATSTFLTSLVSLSAAYATDFKGVIKDSKGETIPFAVVTLNNSSLGTNADVNGEFVMDLKPGKYEVKVQNMGYEPLTKTITIGNNPVSETFVLKDQALELSEVSITAKRGNPADAIMKQVIAKKVTRQKSIKTYETDIFLKGVIQFLEAPTSIMGIKLDDTMTINGIKLKEDEPIVYFLEQQSKYYYKSPNQRFTKVEAVKQAGDKQGLGFSQMPSIIDIYENKIDVFGSVAKRGFVSPVSDQAFSFYDYKLLGSYFDGRYVIKKIQVTPKRKFENTFSGVLYIVDQEYTIRYVNLKAGKEAGIDMLDSFVLEQSYIQNTAQVWQIQHQLLKPYLSFLGFKMSGYFITNYKNTKVNQSIDPAIFNTKFVSEYNDDALDKNDQYWDTLRGARLEAKEQKYVNIIDSVAVTEATKEVKPVSKVSLTSGYKYSDATNTFSINSPIRWIGFNTIQGWNLDADVNYKKKLNDQNSLNFNWNNQYGFANKNYNFYLSGTYTHTNALNKANQTAITLSGGNTLLQPNAAVEVNKYLNLVTTQFLGLNYMELYQSQDVAIKINKNWGNGFSAYIGTKYAKRTDLNNATTSIWNEDKKDNIREYDLGISPNNEKALTTTIGFDWKIGGNFVKLPKEIKYIPKENPFIINGYFTNVSNVDATTNVNVNKAGLFVYKKMNLKRAGDFRWRVGADMMFNNTNGAFMDGILLKGGQSFIGDKAEYMDWFPLLGYYNHTFLNNNGQSGNYLGEEDILAQAHAEWHLNGLLTNKIPLLRKWNWHLVLGTNLLSNVYGDFTFGFENIGVKFFKGLRVDVVKTFDRTNYKLMYPNLSGSTWGVRIGTTLNNKYK